MTKLFTVENSRLAALLHGDPNEVHKNNRFGKIIAPGLMQLQGFVSMLGWRENHMLEVLLNQPVVVPNLDLEYQMQGEVCSLKDGSQIYSTARLTKVESIPNIPASSDVYHYSFTDENITLQDSDWTNYSEIPVHQVARIVPSPNSDLYSIAAVGVSANSLVRSLKNPEVLPDLFFPVARENGTNACLEEKLCLYMGSSSNLEKHDCFELEVSSPALSPQNKRGIIATIGESSGLYVLEMYLTKIPLKVFKRMLK